VIIREYKRNQSYYMYMQLLQFKCDISFFIKTYLSVALHLYLKIKIAAINVVRIATETFVSSMRHPAGKFGSFSGTWNIVPFPACQDQTIRFASLGSIYRNLYRLQKSISVVQCLQ